MEIADEGPVQLCKGQGKLPHPSATGSYTLYTADSIQDSFLRRDHGTKLCGLAIPTARGTDRTVYARTLPVWHNLDFLWVPGL